MNWLFYEPYDDIRLFLEEHRDASWISRGTCYPSNYMYYLWSYRVNPYVMNIPVNGVESFGNDSINEFPERLYIRNNYVVSDTDQASLELLSQLGYISVKLGSHFFFICPFENYDVIAEQQQLFYLDNIHVQENEIKFFGWCIDMKTDTPFAGYLLEVDDTPVEVQRAERSDVVDVMQREDYLESGFMAMLPLDTLGTCNSLTLTGIRADGSAEIIYQIIHRDY